jgi:hypothetical protein
MNQLPHALSAASRARFACDADGPPDDEKIGVRCIRLCLNLRNARAVVGNFFAADKLLHAWATDLNGVLACDFEIVYNDDCTLSGRYQFRRKGTSRPALMQFVRAAASARCAAGALDAPCPVQGLAQRSLAFLDQYETEDFALA